MYFDNIAQNFLSYPERQNGNKILLYMILAVLTIEVLSILK